MQAGFAPMADLDPVVRTAMVVAGVDRAFSLFTERIGTWWPLAGRSVGGPDRVAEVVFEPALGGRVFELWGDGTRHEWAVVTAWDPPRFVALEWRPDPSRPAPTLVEVTFEPVGDVICRVTLVHSGWDLLGADGPDARDSYEAGWPAVLAQLGLVALPDEVIEAIARQTNQATWALLGRDDRDDLDNEQLVHLSHTSAWCWSRVGGATEATRAAWLVSRAHVVTGGATEAARFAARALERCETEGIGGFDLAYAYEAMARSAAALGDAAEARRWQLAAVAQNDTVADPEDRGLVASDLAAGPWFGLDPG